jgi:hypothetical protein
MPSSDRGQQQGIAAVVYGTLEEAILSLIRNLRPEHRNYQISICNDNACHNSGCWTPGRTVPGQCQSSKASDG